MKITFDNKGRNYLEIYNRDNKVVIIISAENMGNSLKTIINSAEITTEQFQKIVSEIIKTEAIKSEIVLDIDKEETATQTKQSGE